MARLLQIALALAAVAISQAAIEEDEGVLVLTKDNFDEAIEKYNPLLVEFYAPWCGHCKKLAPEYAKAAQQLSPSKLLAKVDADSEGDLARRFGIQGFPTLKFFRGDVSAAAEYNGPRDAAGIVNWVKKKSGPATVAVADAAAARKLQDNGVAVIGFFAEAPKAFNDAAASNDDVAFGVSDSDEVRTEYGVGAGESAIVLLNNFPGQENVVRYTGSTSDSKELAAFVEANSLPLVVPFSQENAPKIFRGSVKTHFLLFVDEAEEGTEAIMSAFREVAKAHNSKMLFVSVDPSQSNVVKFFGLEKKDFPAAAIVTMPEGAQMKKFMMPAGEPLTAEAFTSFVTEYSAGSLKPHLKSEEAPATQTGSVVTVVGKTFESIALDPTKDVLVEFYAPWCGHCKNLAPTYEKVGDAFKGVDSVVIAKIDATANEVDYPNVNVRGFPTILLFKAGEGATKEVVEFDGSRDVDGFIKFIKDNAGKSFKLDAAAATGASEDDLEL